MSPFSTKIPLARPPNTCAKPHSAHCNTCTDTRTPYATPTPLLRAGAPLNNGTLFCNLDACYVYRPAMATFEAARNACQALGGDVVAYPSFEAQAVVEKYFAKQVPLYSYWWVAQVDS